MTSLSNAKFLWELTIPGACDAAALSSVLFVGCHTMTFTEQLNAGLRYFDLRAGFSQRSPNEGSNRLSRSLFHQELLLEPPFGSPNRQHLSGMLRSLGCTP